MTFVEVHCRIISAEDVEHLPAADAEHDLLPETLLQVSRVESGGYPPVLGFVAVDISVQEVERHPADLNLPDGDVDGRVDVRDLNHQVFAGRIEHPGDGCCIRVERFVDIQLPPLVVDHLAQVALRVHESDSNHRETKVARLFEVVAGEESEPARIDGKRVVKPVLSREVGDRE